MTTNPGPGDRSADGAVHVLLWRLRARLVTPPTEERGRSDLDRLIDVARERAHEVPSPGATARPDPSSPSTSPRFPLRPVAEAPSALPTDELAARRRPAGVAHGLSRVVAAGIAVLVIGVGTSSAINGPVVITALLGRDAAPAPDVAAPDGSEDQDASEDEAVAAPEGEPEVTDDPVVTDPEADIEVVEPESPEEVLDDQDEVSDPDDAGTDAGGGQDRSPANPGTDAEGSGGTSSSDPEPAPEVEEPAEEPSQEQIIAAPPAAGVDGFGGARCEVDAVADCIEDGIEGGPVTDGTGDEVADDEPSAEDLAARRYRP